MDSTETLSPQEGYAAWAPLYDDDGNPLIALEGPAVRDWFGPIAGKWALDLGCGTGRHTLALVERGARVVALDQSPEMLARARRKLAGQPVAWVRQALPAPLPLPDEAFGLVVMGLVAEHIADLAALMAEAARVVAPGGRVILSALHAERTGAGETARFIDPRTGLRRPILTIHRPASTYLAAAEAAGLAEPEARTLVVPPEVAAAFPRAERYLGLPLGWVARWTRPADGPQTGIKAI